MNLLLQRILQKLLNWQGRKAVISHLTENDLRQDEDVLDTWFSSWLWPITSFDGINNPDNADIKYYYPTNDLITAPEILFFWVARMIIAGYEYREKNPLRMYILQAWSAIRREGKCQNHLGIHLNQLTLLKNMELTGSG